jgi:nitrate reductase gamma subunit
MAIETEHLIKIIIGVIVVVAVAAGLFLFFKNQIIEFLKGLSAGSPSEVFIGLIK